MTTGGPRPALLGVDALGRQRLIRMKRTAASALLAAAAIYLLAVVAWPSQGPAGFVRSAAEAAMVGGLADWFAVTALFRHPLGLRIPHTALVPTKKAELATKLGEFVLGNFFTADAVSAEISRAGLLPRVAHALAHTPAAQRAAVELARAVAAALAAVDAHVITRYLLALADRDLHRRSYAPVLGRLLAQAVRGRGQRPLIDVILLRALEGIREHRDLLHEQLRGFLAQQGFLARRAIRDWRIEALLDTASTRLAQMAADPDDPLREALDGLLGRLAAALQHDPGVAADFDGVLHQLLTDPRTSTLTTDLVADGMDSLRRSLLERADLLEPLIREVASRVADDAALSGRLERLLDRAARYVVTTYGDTAVALIQRTVAGWDARDASRRIEDAVGRDLQFIRINGTVVGALVGVGLHAVGTLLG